MGRTGCKDLQCLYNTSVPLLYLCFVRNLKIFSACTGHLYISYTYVMYTLYESKIPVE